MIGPTAAHACAPKCCNVMFVSHCEFSTQHVSRGRWCKRCSAHKGISWRLLIQKRFSAKQPKQVCSCYLLGATMSDPLTVTIASHVSLLCSSAALCSPQGGLFWWYLTTHREHENTMTVLLGISFWFLGCCVTRWSDPNLCTSPAGDLLIFTAVYRVCYQLVEPRIEQYNTLLRRHDALLNQSIKATAWWKLLRTMDTSDCLTYVQTTVVILLSGCTMWLGSLPNKCWSEIGRP